MAAATDPAVRGNTLTTSAQRSCRRSLELFCQPDPAAGASGGARRRRADWSLSAGDVVELASAGCDDPVELFPEGPSRLVLGCTRSAQ